MKTKIVKSLLLALFINLGLNVFAQVAINTDGSVPDSSAMLDVKSTSKGLLLPRLTTTQLQNIISPSAGLLIFNTDSADFYGYNGTNWVSIWAPSSDTIGGLTCGDTLYDSRNGSKYTTVQIGSQCWMAENLNIGTMINGSGNQTDNDTIEKYCYNNSTSNCDTYGGLYQWDEMMQYATTEGAQGICPTGWHLPSDAEWCTLEQEVDPTITCSSTGWRGVDGGGKLKEAGTTHWNSPNTGATNSSGFTALPGGYCTPTMARSPS